MNQNSEKPFIHLFQALGNYYFYDVNKNGIEEISKDTYIYLKNYSQNLEIEKNTIVSEEILRLKKCNYLSNKRVYQIEYHINSNLEMLTKRVLNNLILQITQDCNLECSYCVYTQKNDLMRIHSIKKMSWQTAKKSIDYLWQNSVDANVVNLSFYGGEPLLSFDFIKECVEYFNNKFINKRKMVTITTNGTLINQKIAEFLAEYDFNLTISLDGSKEVNDKNRLFKNSNLSVFETVIRNLSFIYTNYRNYFDKISLNIVIDPKNDFESYLNLFDDHSFLNNLKVSCSIIDDSTLDNKNNFSEKFMKQYNYYLFLAQLENLKRFSFLINNPLYESIKNSSLKVYDELKEEVELNNTSIPSGPCLPSIHRFMVNVNGKIFPCEKVNEKCEVSVLGDIENGIDIDNIYKILNYTNNFKQECINCFAFRHCTNCVRILNNNEIFEIDIKEHCRKVKVNLSNSFISKVIVESLNSMRFDEIGDV